MAQSAALQKIHDFTGIDGADSRGTLLLADDGNFFGTPAQGGAFGLGTVFRMTASGEVTVLHEFQGPDGQRPLAGLTQGSDGLLYGVTIHGGARDVDFTYGEGVKESSSAFRKTETSPSAVAACTGSRPPAT